MPNKKEKVLKEMKEFGVKIEKESSDERENKIDYTNHVMKVEMVIGPEVIQQDLYTDHVFKKEMVIGPEVIQPKLYTNHVIKEEIVIGPEVILPDHVIKQEIVIEPEVILPDLYTDHIIKEEMVIGPEVIQTDFYATCSKDAPLPKKPRQTQIETTDQKSDGHGEKRMWVNDINKRREESEFSQLCRELESDEDRFYEYFHMSRSSFEELHELLKPHILKYNTNFRKAIGTRERLAIFMRYIRTGDSFVTISLSFRVGRSTVSKVIKEVSIAIWKILQPINMKSPTEETWKQSELSYRELWNFPNCVGSIDGKQVRIECNSSSGLSIMLIAVVDPYYKFSIVDIGTYGDRNVLENSEFFRQYLDRKSFLPPKPLPGTSEPIPHVLIGDDVFALKSYLMRPFPKLTAKRDPRKQRYNDVLTHACLAEKTLNMLSEKWRVFNRPMECNVEKAVHVTKAACCLHNYVRMKLLNVIQSPKDGKNTPQAQSQDLGEVPVMVNMSRRQKRARALIPIKPTNTRSPNEALNIREKFVAYFNR